MYCTDSTKVKINLGAVKTCTSIYIFKGISMCLFFLLKAPAARGPHINKCFMLKLVELRLFF